MCCISASSVFEDLSMWLHSLPVTLSLHSILFPCSFFFSVLKIPSSLSQAPLASSSSTLLQEHMQAIFMPFHQSSLISLRLNPQPDNAWRRPVLYRSIRFYSSLQGKWSVKNVMYMAQRLHKCSVFRWPSCACSPKVHYSYMLHLCKHTYQQQNMYKWETRVCWIPVSTKSNLFII